MLVKDNNPNIRMETFEVSITGDSFLYANGHQQVKVTVKARKQVKDNDGFWVSQSLTQQEKNSVTLQTLNGHNPAESVGISVAHESAGYEFGQWPKQRELPQEKPNVRNDAFDYIDLYVSTSKTEPQEMVGFISLDGSDGSENSWNSDDLGQTNTIVTIMGTPPYSIKAEQMTLHRDDIYNYSIAKNRSCDIDIYYWDLPLGLTYKSLALENVEGYGGGDPYYFYTRLSVRYMFCRLMPSTQTSLHVYETIGRGQEDAYKGVVPDSLLTSFNPSNGRLIAARHSCDMSIGYATRNTGGGIFNFTDNYGCEHKLKAIASSDGNTISLHNL